MKKFVLFLAVVGLAWWWISGHYTAKDLLAWSDTHKNYPVAEKMDYYVGMYHFVRTENGKAEEAFNQLLANHTTASAYAPQALLRLGDIYQDETKWEKAAVTYEDFLEYYPGHPEAGEVKKKLEYVKGR